MSVAKSTSATIPTSVSSATSMAKSSNVVNTVNTSSKKYALLIGINYTGTPNALAGCINDTKNIQTELIKRGYPSENITILTDETLTKPTRENILNNFMRLISGPG